MQRPTLLTDLETWMRYLYANFKKKVIDLSALLRIIMKINENQEYLDAYVQVMVSYLDSDLEINAIMTLHTINFITTNLKYMKGNIAYQFLCRVIDEGADILIRNMNKGWVAWNSNLTRTLQEWKGQFNINSRIPDFLNALQVNSENLKNIHHGIMEDRAFIDAIFHDKVADQISHSILRLWLGTIKNPEQLKEPYTGIIRSYSNAEGQKLFRKSTNIYIKNMLKNPSLEKQLFRQSGNDRFLLIAQANVSAFSGCFIENAAGGTVRNIIEQFSQGDYITQVNKEDFKAQMNHLMAMLKHTIKSIHGLTPMLGKLICTLCDDIVLTKGRDEYWDEMNNLIVLKLLAPAVSNPVLTGIADYAPNDAIKALAQAAKLIQHAWAGKLIDHGGLLGVTDLSWYNERIPNWQGDLRQEFTDMYTTWKNRPVEPNVLIFPKAVIIYDLKVIETEIRQSPVNLSSPQRPPSPEEVKKESSYQEEIEEQLPVAPRPQDFAASRKVMQEEKEPAFVQKRTDYRPPSFKADDDIQIAPDESRPPSFNIEDIKRFKNVNPAQQVYIDDESPSMDMLPPVILSNQSPSIVSLPPANLLLNPNKPAQSSRASSQASQESTNRRRVKIIRENSSDWEIIKDIEETSSDGNNKEIQTLKQHSQLIQTSGFVTRSKYLQTDEQQTDCREIQTDPEPKQLGKQSVQVKDKEVETELQIESVYEINEGLKTELEELQRYADIEQDRSRDAHRKWATEFNSARDENQELKATIKQLQERLAHLKANIPKYQEIKSFTHSDLRDEMISRFHMNDEKILTKIDPRYYLGCDTPTMKSSRSQSMSHTNDNPN